MNPQAQHSRGRRFPSLCHCALLLCALVFSRTASPAQAAQQGPLTPPPESLVIEAKPGADGKIYEKTVERPQSSLHYLEMGPEDFQSVARMPAYPLTTGQLAKYNLKYLGKELVDEVDCYIFQVKPKAVERTHAYFDGIVWVDAVYLEVVKTYGKWITDLGDMRSATMPFTIFETYRENVEGKYWLPNYMRSDDTLNLKDMNIQVRLVIKWTDYKPLPAATAAPPLPAALPKPNS
jgi:hypothetical protein